MKYYTTKDVAGIFRVAEGTINNWRRAGKFPHARKNGHWIFPQCCVDDPEGKGHSGLVETDELAIIEKEIKIAEATIKRDEIIKKRELPEVLVQREAELDSREEALGLKEQEANRVASEQSSIKEALKNKEAALNEALEDIKEWRKLFTHDINKLREYYSGLCDTCKQSELPELSGLDLPEVIYTSTEPLNPTYEPDSLYDEREDEEG